MNSIWNLNIYIIDYIRIMRNVYFSKKFMKFFYTKICKNSFWNLDIYIIGYTRIIRNVYFRMHVSDYRFCCLGTL